MTRNDRTLTRLIDRTGSSLDTGPGPPETSPQYLGYRFWQEISLSMGSLFLAFGGGAAMIVISYVGYRLGGNHGQNAMLDVGIGLASIGVAGWALHLLRASGILIYRRLLFHRQDPLFMETAPPPSALAQRLFASTDRDFLIQVAAAIIVAVIAFHVLPP